MHALSSRVILSMWGTEFLPEDDIDQLFEKLRKLEPPGDIVKQVLARVKRLPVTPVVPVEQKARVLPLVDPLPPLGDTAGQLSHLDPDQSLAKKQRETSE